MASPIEVLQGTLTSGSTTTNVTVTTALAAGDLLLLVSAAGSAGGTWVTPTGLGTWQLLHSYTSSLGVRVHAMTGATAGGVVTLTRSTTSSTTDYVLLVIRGLDVAVVDALVVDAAEGSAEAEMILQAYARANSVAVSILHSIASPVNPASGSDPASGWTTHRNTTGSNGISVASRDIASGQLVTARTTFASSSVDSYAILLVAGTPNESRNYSTRLEALTGPTGHPPSAVAGEYAEAITKFGPPERSVGTEYLEALTYARPPSELAGLYVEAIETRTNGGPSIRTEYLEAVHTAPLARGVRAEYLEALTAVEVAVPVSVNTAYLETLLQARDAQAVAAYLEVLRVAALSEAPTRFPVWGVPLW